MKRSNSPHYHAIFSRFWHFNPTWESVKQVVYVSRHHGDQALHHYLRSCFAMRHHFFCGGAVAHTVGKRQNIALLILDLASDYEMTRTFFFIKAVHHHACLTVRQKAGGFHFCGAENRLCNTALQFCGNLFAYGRNLVYPLAKALIADNVPQLFQLAEAFGKVKLPDIPVLHDDIVNGGIVKRIVDVIMPILLCLH